MNYQGYSRPVVLCLDDQATALELEIRKRVLETAGYGVVTTTGGHKALETFRDNHVDLVLSEQVVPVFTLAVIKMMKPEVPIAIYSAYWEAPTECMRFADAFITKLVSVDELLCTIECLLEKRSTAVAA